MKVKRILESGMLPDRAHYGDLGYDLFCAQQIKLFHGVPTKVRTGIAAHYEGHGFLIRDRSSLAASGITVSGGVIDEGYRGEISVIMTNTWPDKRKVTFFVGDKIAQMIPIPVLAFVTPVEVEQLPNTERGTGGFGSTDKKDENKS